MDLEKLRFPIGKRIPVNNPDKAQIDEWIADIEAFPAALQLLVQNLTKEQLSYRYRPDGWTIKQVVHHCADSHINGIVKFKLALTEDSPTIKPYQQALWADTIDGLNDDISYSLELLKALHAKWIVLLKNLRSDELQRDYIHPEHNKKFTVEESIQIYSWHCRHHYAHIQNALESGGKYKG